MATHADIASNLLRNAATFFRDLGAQNPDLAKQMEMNARTYDAVANMVERDPNGQMALPDESGGVDAEQSSDPAHSGKN